MQRIPVLLLLVLAACRPQGASRQQDSADSLIAFMKDEVNPYFHDHRPREAGHLLDSLLPLVKQAADYRATCNWLRCKGVQYNMQKQYDSARYFIDQAMQLAVQQDSTGKQILGANVQMADLMREQEQHDSALRYAREAYYLAKKVDTPGLPIICFRLSEIYNDIGDAAAVRRYLFEGYERCTQPRLKTVLANSISKYYKEEGHTDSAILFFREMQRDTSFSNPYFDAVLHENLGVLLVDDHKPKEGLQHQLQAMEINRALNELTGDSYLNLAVTYSKLEQYGTATTYLDSALHLATAEKDQNTITRSWNRRANNLAAQGNYKAAFTALDSAYESFAAEQDSSLALQARELETQYAVKAKDDEIAALAFENKVNRQIRRQQQVIIAVIAIAAVLLGILGVLLWRRRAQQLELREAALRQRLLRSQMEPHFIFNTLSVLQSFIRSNEREKSIKYLNKFARLVRISLENARESIVPLKDELVALESYLSLQAMRFEGAFDFKIEVYDHYEEDGLLIPPMLLQPFVENAILHGLRRVEQGGMVTVRIERRQHTLHCVIEDNGSGMQPAEAGEEKQSLSTIITQERLAMLSKQTGYPATLQITDKKAENGHGIKVEMNIPFRKSSTAQAGRETA
ncbi:histidine kinase [Chitinophaga sp.]|uniref:tetratricopeptide repeat-containing sensor histidine kinase n=1 Tax=Chitinophaga sp. TaxID=1869181 RepID=UPI0031D2DFFE